MVDNALFVSLVNSCTGGSRFYQCSEGGFSGCCSIDPCDTGVCPSENQPSDLFQPTSIVLIPPPITTAWHEIITVTETPSTFYSTYSAFETLTAPSATDTKGLVAVQSGASPSTASANQISSSGAIIGGVVGGVLSVIILFTAILFRFRQRNQSKLPHDSEKCADNGNSSSGHGYSDSIFDSYLSNRASNLFGGLGIQTLAKNTKQAKLPPLRDWNDDQPGSSKRSPCHIFPAKVVKPDQNSDPFSSPPLVSNNVTSPARYLRKSPSSLSASSGSSDKTSIPGGVPIPASARSISMGSYTTGSLFTGNTEQAERDEKQNHATSFMSYSTNFNNFPPATPSPRNRKSSYEVRSNGKEPQIPIPS